VIKFLAKVMSVTFRLQGQALRVFRKISTPHCVRVVFFCKNLAYGVTLIDLSQKFNNRPKGHK